MPIYEYRCSECNHKFEVLLKKKEDSPETCPACGKSSLKKLFSSFSPSVKNNSGCDSLPECPSGGCCSGSSCPMQ